jgi:hypothetical protein
MATRSLTELRAFPTPSVSNAPLTQDWLCSIDDLSNAKPVYKDNGLRVVLNNNRSHRQQKFVGSDRSQRLRLRQWELAALFADKGKDNPHSNQSFELSEMAQAIH